MPLLGHATPEPLPVRVSRAGRAALAGLILPPALLAIASMLGYPARTGVDSVILFGALAGFAATGWMTGRNISPSRAVALRTAVAFSAGGMLVAPSFNSLQGLSGREPAVLVVAGTLSGFALGFGLAGAATAVVAGLRGRAFGRAAALTAVGGGLGGLLALLPYGWSQLGFSGPVATYGGMAVAVVALLGCVLVPCRMIGVALEHATAESLPE